MKKAFFGLWLTLLMPFSHTGWAVEYDAAGAGTMPCGHYLSSSEAEKLMAHSWAQGFLTALNLVRGTAGYQSVDIADVGVQKVWVENYCHDNPIKKFATAIVELHGALRKSQGLPAIGNEQNLESSLE